MAKEKETKDKSAKKDKPAKGKKGAEPPPVQPVMPDESEMERLRAEALEAAAQPQPTAPRLRPSVQEQLVEDAELLEFLFPTAPVKYYHPSSAARLFIFARFGPLEDGHVTAGPHHRRRALSASELGMLIDQLQREDLMAVYVGDRELPPADQEEVLREARHLRHKLYDYTRAEVEAFLAHVRERFAIPAGSGIPFGLLQRCVERERAFRFQQLRQLFPPIVTKAGQLTPLQRGATFKPISQPPKPARPRMDGAVLIHGLAPRHNLERLRREVLGDRFGPVRNVFWRADKSGAKSDVAVAVFASPAASRAALAQLEGAVHMGRRMHLELPLAPEPDLGSFEAAERLLSTRAWAISQLGDNVNDPGLRQNTMLMRADYKSRPRPEPHDARQWDDLHGFRGQGRPSYVDDRSSRHIADFVAAPALSTKVGGGGPKH